MLKNNLWLLVIFLINNCYIYTLSDTKLLFTYLFYFFLLFSIHSLKKKCLPKTFLHVIVSLIQYFSHLLNCVYGRNKTK
jgi:hypothetical protein